MIGLLTDSNAQLPPELAERYGVEVVPLTVTVDGEEFAEGVDLDADTFYARFEGGRRPEVSTSQPSPGRFAEAFAALAGRGAREILAVHVGSVVSGTVNSARLAAQSSPVPVHIVDTATVSFGVACCVWEAGEALARGVTVEEAAAIAGAVGKTVGTVFTVGALDLARAGGRLAPGGEAGTTGPGVPVLTMAGGEMQVIGEAGDVDGAAGVMADHVLAVGDGPGVRVGLGIADASAAPLWRALEERLTGAPGVREIVRYRIGPSVGAHTGPGTAGVFFYPSG
ncbi:MAG: DegV family protein [Acidimicrobiia bacterium]|nr:DegV family protein [Acidimicrobiia bacterium]